MSKQWWAYRHVNGKIKVEQYDQIWGRIDMQEADTSNFAAEVVGPYYAPNRYQAEEKAKAKLSQTQKVKGTQ